MKRLKIAVLVALWIPIIAVLLHSSFQWLSLKRYEPPVHYRKIYAGLPVTITAVRDADPNVLIYAQTADSRFVFGCENRPKGACAGLESSLVGKTYLLSGGLFNPPGCDSYALTHYADDEAGRSRQAGLSIDVCLGAVSIR